MSRPREFPGLAMGGPRDGQMLVGLSPVIHVPTHEPPPLTDRPLGDLTVSVERSTYTYAVLGQQGFWLCQSERERLSLDDVMTRLVERYQERRRS